MSALGVRRLGKLNIKNSVLFLCDIQEKFRPTISYFPQVVNVAQRMLAAANLLEVPVVVTEQYPKGLGHTVKELDVSKCPIFPKTQFSMWLPEVENHLKKFPEVKSVVLCGIEAQACILQTVLDLVEKDFDVHVVADAVSARSMVDRMFALQRIREVGGFVTTSESVMLMLCRDASHPKFREIQKIISTPSPDSGLLLHNINEGTAV